MTISQHSDIELPSCCLAKPNIVCVEYLHHKVVLTHNSLYTTELSTRHTSPSMGKQIYGSNHEPLLPHLGQNWNSNFDRDLASFSSKVLKIVDMTLAQ